MGSSAMGAAWELRNEGAMGQAWTALWVTMDGAMGGAMAGAMSEVLKAV